LITTAVVCGTIVTPAMVCGAGAGESGTGVVPPWVSGCGVGLAPPGFGKGACAKVIGFPTFVNTDTLVCVTALNGCGVTNGCLKTGVPW
jgi:hypothetical protein